MSPRRRTAELVTFLLIPLCPVNTPARFDTAGPADPAGGAGVFVAGELWDSFLPPNVRATYIEANQPLRKTFLRIGNFEREWRTPTHMWPGGWPYGMFWSKGMLAIEFNPDTTWNPPVIADSANPSYDSISAGMYAFAAYAPSVLGANNPARQYARETRWVDPERRDHALYEAGWPTTIGVDVTLRVHQFTLPWNNFNDFILAELTFTNTGLTDMNADGIADSAQTGRTGLNRIRALALTAHGEVFGSYMLTAAGVRSSKLGAARGIGYVGDPDAFGAPWDMVVAFCGESIPGIRDMGLNAYPDRYYSDVWSAWAWIAAKQGAGPPGALPSLPDKPTLFGTHPIGAGAERGWYSSAGQGYGLGFGYTAPRNTYIAATGTWYVDGGKSRETSKFNLNPNPRFFSGGTAGDITTFVPRASGAARPNGDRKLLSEDNIAPSFEVTPYEPGWTKGFSGANNFDGDLFSGIGPFALEPGESMTVVWAEAGGFRLTGVQNAIAAARWAFEHGLVLPQAPATPHIKVEHTLEGGVRVRWDNRAEVAPGFAGYKIYRVYAADSVDWINGGMRLMDNYWRVVTPGPLPPQWLAPYNAAFQAFDFIAGRRGAPGAWGPYTLVASYAADQLARIAENAPGGFTYAWEDPASAPKRLYWYSVSAYTSGSYDLGPRYAGQNPPQVSVLETFTFNRNGASGLWQNTYPWATLNVWFPKTWAEQSLLGAGFEAAYAPSTPAQLNSGEVRVGVFPNPYKRRGSWERGSDVFDHTLYFTRVPPRSVITILDVSGQVIDEIRYEQTDPSVGTVPWDMFSKAGIEVASGLYIYVVQYDGGKQVGYFSILR